MGIGCAIPCHALTIRDNDGTVADMALESDPQELGTRTDMKWREGGAFLLGLTEPDGGDMTISIETHPGSDRYIGVRAGSKQARSIAETMGKLADTIEEWEKNHA